MTDDSELRRGRLSLGGLAKISSTSSFGPLGRGRGRIRRSRGSRRPDASSDRDDLWLPIGMPLSELFVFTLVIGAPINVE